MNTLVGGLDPKFLLSDFVPFFTSMGSEYTVESVFCLKKIWFHLWSFQNLGGWKLGEKDWLIDTLYFWNQNLTLFGSDAQFIITKWNHWKFQIVFEV